MRSSLIAVLTTVLVVSFSGVGRAAVPIPKAPDVNARAYILVDHFSGRVLAEDHADDREEPASLTKLMTSYAVFTALRKNRLKLADTVDDTCWYAGEIPLDRTGSYGYTVRALPVNESLASPIELGVVAVA